MPFPKVEIRPRRSMAFFALLSIVMVVVSYLFVILLAAACVYLPYLALTISDSPGFQILALFVFGIVIAGAMLWSLVPRPDKFKPPGLLLDRSAQPRLFAELENIAASLNEPMPREVYLIGDVNAWVADRGGFMGFGSRRVMGLGLPLFSTLTVSQFRAILAHEFAHYYGGDTSLGPWVYKTQTAMVRIFQNVGSLGKLARMAILGMMYLVVATLMKWYFMLFLRAINLASRQRELRADELACMIAGRQPLIDGLRTIHGTAMAWPAYWQTELAPVLNDGAMPGIAEGFARFVSVPAIQEQIQKGIEQQIQEAKIDPYDTHPPLRDRIAATEKFSSSPIQQDSQPARTLLEKPEATEVRFLEGANPDLKSGSLKCITWDEVGAQITIPQWRTFVADYASFLEGVTAASLPDQIAKFPAIGNKMRDPKGMLLGPDQRTRRAGQLFAAGFGAALLDHGWQLVSGPGVFHLERGSEKLNPFLVVDHLMSNKITPQDWVAKCNALGIAQLTLLPAPPLQPVLPGLERAL
jgi:Zn-dependent protease with chaperone function